MRRASRCRTAMARHFRSFDGKERACWSRAAGGPSWYTEYNVFAGLSARSFGALRLLRDPHRRRPGQARPAECAAPLRLSHLSRSIRALRRVHERAQFQASTGVQRFLDMTDLRHARRRARPLLLRHGESDHRARARQWPAVHLHLSRRPIIFHGTFRYRPDLTPDWRDPGNAPDVDEYLRRQAHELRATTANFSQRLSATSRASSS